MRTIWRLSKNTSLLDLPSVLNIVTNPVQMNFNLEVQGTDLQNFLCERNINAAVIRTLESFSGCMQTKMEKDRTI